MPISATAEGRYVGRVPRQRRQESVAFNTPEGMSTEFVLWSPRDDEHDQVQAPAREASSAMV